MDLDDDGVINLVDVDDDNDGILDIVECPSLENTFDFGAAAVSASSGVDASATMVEAGVTASLDLSTEYGTLAASTGGGFTDRNPDGDIGGVYIEGNTANGDTATMSLGFSQPIDDVYFYVTDIDGGNGSSAELVTITGSLLGTDVVLSDDMVTVVPGTGPKPMQSGNALSGLDAGGSNVVRVQFETPIDELVVEFSSTNVDATTTQAAVRMFNINFAQFCDADGDSVSDHFDLDSDNDGVGDNVEAQLTQAFVAASGVDSDNNGLDDAYETTPGAGEGLTPVNTDGVDDVDYLDLDSDNDAETDLGESGLGLVDGDGDGRTDGTVGVNGLDNSAETADDYSDVDGLSHNGTAFTLADSDGDTSPDGSNAVATKINLDYRDNTVPFVAEDLDGDGVANLFDIDDDNDGIVDVVECSSIENRFDFGALAQLSATPGVDASATMVEAGVTASLDLTSEFSYMRTSTSGHFADRNPDGEVGSVVVNGSSVDQSAATLSVAFSEPIDDVYFYIADIDNADKVTITGSLLGTDVVLSDDMVTVVPGSGPKPAQSGNVLSGNNVSDDNAVRVEFETLIDELVVEFSTTGAGVTVHTLVRMFNINFAQLCDADGDSVSDHFDLDSDNDGVGDNVEAQLTQAFVAASGVDSDNNGLDDAYETTPGAGEGLTPVNTDGVDDVDYLDLDSDNDAETDLGESGLGLVDGDGDGRTDGTVGVNGLDNSAETADDYSDVDGLSHNGTAFTLADSDGDTSPDGSNAVATKINLDYRDTVVPFPAQDNDGDGIVDWFDVDDDNDGIVDVVECSSIENMFDFGAVAVQATPGVDASATLAAGGVTASLDLTSEFSRIATSTGGHFSDRNPDGHTSSVIVNGYSVDQSVASLSVGFSEPVDDVFFYLADIDISDQVTVTGSLLGVDVVLSDDMVTAVPGYGPKPVQSGNVLAGEGDGVSNDSATLVRFESPIDELVVEFSSTVPGESRQVVVRMFDINFMTVCDADGDSVSDHFDLDSDNDGVGDNVEAQLTQAFVAASGVDSDNNGLDDAYETTPGAGEGLTPVNTDGVDDVDYLDLDSDNDAETDLGESGLGLVDGDGDGRTDGTVGVNGLDNSAETADDYSDVDGLSHNGTAFTLADSDGDTSPDGSNAVATKINLDYRDNTVPFVAEDLDGDGVANLFDIDDDNDGIVDVVECSSIENRFDFGALAQLSATPGVDASATMVEAGVTASLDLTSEFSYMRTSTSGHFADRNPDGEVGSVVVNGSSVDQSAATLSVAFSEPIDDVYFYIADIDNADKVTITGSLLGTDVVLSDDMVTVVPGSGPKPAQSGNVLSGNNVSDDNAVRVEFETLIDELVVEFSTTGAGVTVHTLVRMFNINFAQLCDADGDSVSDHFDLDSDNDGVGDNVEAQLTQAFVAASGVDSDNNGLDDAYETTPGAGEGLTPVNTDGVDDVDYLDLDSDNDAETDLGESGLGLVDGDGDGRTDGTVGVNGLDNSAETADDYSDVDGLSHNGTAFTLSDSDGDTSPDGSNAITTKINLDYRDDNMASWTLVKATTSTPTNAGDTLEYTFTVTNTGNVTISDVAVADAKCAAAPTLTSGDLNSDSVLDTDEVWVFGCTSVAVTQAEVDAGEVVNDATVSGTAAVGGGSLADGEASVTTVIDADASWTLVKATTSTPTNAGDTLEYTFTVTNTGNVTISDVAVADAKCAAAPTLTSGDLNSDSVLDTDEVWVFGCTSVAVTQAEVDAGEVVNDATVSGTAASGSLADGEASVTTVIDADASWTLVKATASTPTNAGDTLEYTFTVTNTGNVTISDVAVADAKCAAAPTLTSGDLNSDSVLDTDEVWVFGCTSVAVTQAEVDAGEVVNDATVSGTAASGSLAEGEASVTTVIDADASWTLVKATTSTPTNAGDTLEYTFTVTNTGNVTISDVAVADAKCAAAPTLDVESAIADGALTGGEFHVWSCTSIPVTQAEVDAGLVVNEASATGTTAGGPITPAEDTNNTAIVPAPAWTVDKTTASDPAEVDDTLEYDFSVTNTGNVTIASVVVTDAKCAAEPALDSGDTDNDAVLDTDETWIYSCTSIPVTQAEVDAGQVNNTVSVTGTPATGDLAPASDSHVAAINSDPAIIVIKASATVPSGAGDVLDYTFSVVNTGNVTINDLIVVDAKCASEPVLDTESMVVDSALQSGETQIWSCTSIPVTQAEVDAGEVLNTSSTSGTPTRGTLDPYEDTHTISIAGDPSWDMIKATTDVPMFAGDSLSYTFSLTNTGNVTISDVAIADAKCSAAPTLDSESAISDAVLTVGETQIWSCSSIPVTQDEIDTGVVTNTATANGTPSSGSIATAEATLETVAPANPSWTLDKMTDSSPSQAGDVLDYTFAVHNTGNVTITDVTVADAKCANGPSLDAESATADGELEVGETQTYICTSIPVTQSEVDDGQVNNEATAAGTPVRGTLAPAAASASVSVDADPSWNVIKSSADTSAALGDTIGYTFTIINTGNVTVSDVVITDAKCATAVALDSESITADTALEVGETQIWSCTSVPVTQAEVDAGQIDNSVVVTGTPAGGVLEQVTGEHIIFANAQPSWAASKTTGTVITGAGDVADYSFAVTNTGNVSISNVAVTDERCESAPGLDSESITANDVLEVGETQLYSCTSIPVTQDEVDAGQVVNVATVTGTSSGGTLEALAPEHTLEVAAAPSWQVSKTTTSAPNQAGDTLQYTFAVTNSGNVTISDVEVSDAKCAQAPTLDSGDEGSDTLLGVDEVWLYSCTSIAVTQAEIDAEQIVNSVAVTGSAAGTTLEPATDEHTVVIDQQPAMEVSKATSTAVDTVGGTLDYTFSVVNTGNVGLAEVTVSDTKCASEPMLDFESITADTDLQVGETHIYSCTSIPVTQDEIDSGQVDNDVTVTSLAPDNSEIEAADGHSALADPEASWKVTKSATTVATDAGDSIDYTITIVNDGNVTINDVIIADPKCATAVVLDSESIASDDVLQVGEVHVYSCTSVPVTQAEVDAGEVLNTATATGTPTLGNLDAATAPHRSLVTAQPGWDMVKSTQSVPSEVGDTLDYTFSLTNTGNVTITDVTLEDAQCVNAPALDSGDENLDDALDVGETWTYGCTSIPITAAEVDAGKVENTATATGVSAGGTLEDVQGHSTVSVQSFPSFETSKTATAVSIAVGDRVDYAFSVTNTGNVTITDVAIVDERCEAEPQLDFESDTDDVALQAGETQLWSCTSIPVTQAQVQAGEVINTAVTTGTPLGGTLAPSESSHTASVDAVPSFDAGKATTSVPSHAGDTLDYTFTVVNTGNVAINEVSVVDTKCAAAPEIRSESVLDDGDLAVGETQIWGCSSIAVTQAEVDTGSIDNVATITGAPAGGAIEPVEKHHTAQVSAAPSMTLAKTTESVPTQAGDSLTYAFTVVNTGNVTIETVAVVDAKCLAAPALTSESVAPDAVLEAGETQTFACTSVPITQAEADAGQVTNIATATGVPARGSLSPATNTTTTPIDASPQLEAVKTALSGAGAAGSTIDYSFSVVNTGNITLPSVTVIDPKCSAPATLDSESVAADYVLQVGETQRYSCTSIPVTQAEIDAGEVINDALVTGESAGGQAFVTVETSHVSRVTAEPAIEMIKATSSTIERAGETLEYTFTVVNSGNVTIGDVTVDDPKCSADPILNVESALTDGLLAVAEAHIYSCTSIPVTQAEIDAGQVTNTAVVTGNPVGGQLEPAEATSTITVLRDAQLSLNKSATTAPLKAGDSIEYAFTVTNVGNVTLNEVTVVDLKCANAPTLDSGDVEGDHSLAPSETWDLSCTSISVTQAEVDAGRVNNTATATGVTDQDEVKEATATAVTPVAGGAEIALVKEATGVIDFNASGRTDAGDRIEYTFTITNKGTETLTDVTVSDNRAPTDETLDSLAPGESRELKSHLVLTQGDLDAGFVDNSAIASALDRVGATIQVRSDSSDPAATGSVDENGVPIVGDNGDPVDDGIDDNDPTRTTLVSEAMLRLEQRGEWIDANENGAADVGDEILYRFTVENVGSVTVRDIRVQDVRFLDLGVGNLGAANLAADGVTVNNASVSADGFVESLAPGQTDTTTFQLVYAITSDDLARGGVESTASVSGFDPTGSAVVAESDDPTNDADTDTDGDGLPDDSTFVSLAAEAPAMGVAMELLGSTTVTADRQMVFVIRVENLGDVPISSLQATEGLTTVFGASTYNVSDLRVISGPCSINDDFDGKIDTDLLTGSDVLGVAAMCAIELTVRVTPAETAESSSQVYVTGRSPSGAPLNSRSDNGTDTQSDPDYPTTFMLLGPAEPDVSDGQAFGMPVTVSPLANDEVGNLAVKGTLQLRNPATGAWLAKVVVAGQGTWEVDPLTDEVTFTPADALTGDPDPIDYRVAVAGSPSYIGSTIEVGFGTTTPTNPTGPTTATPLPPLVFSGEVPPQVLNPPRVTPRATPPNTPVGDLLAFTGTNVSRLAIAGVTLILVGGALVASTRRKDEEDQA